MNFVKKVLLKLRIPVAIVVLFFVVIFVFPFPAIGKTVLLATEVVPQFPFKPLKSLTKAPIIETVNIKTSQGEVAADIYRPNDHKKHPAVIFTLGIAITKENEQVRQTSEALARSGFVVLTPDLPDFISGFVWTDSVDTLVSSVEYLDRLSFVDKKKIGFAGFCVGASASIIAAEDPKIASKVNFITGVSPYYDLVSLSKATLSRKTTNSKRQIEDWIPAPLTIDSVILGYINLVPNPDERDILKDFFIKKEIIFGDKFDNLSTEAKLIYDFLSSSEMDKVEEAWKKLPQSYRDLAYELSPSTKIGDLRAKLLILNDRKDSYVPKIEGERLMQNLPKGQIYFSEIDSFEHASPKTKLPRWAAVRQFFHLGVFLYNVFSQVG